MAGTGRRKRAYMRNGMLSIYKEAGYTSNDVVAKLRGILHMRRIGHTGTLDPMAEGVLPVCLGNATRLCDMIADRDKEYRAVMRLGLRTDT
jgi:tRNA pseudouridine55 synthase